MSWNVPYSDKKQDAFVLFAIIRGEIPEKPEEKGDPQVFHKLWELCCSSWSEDPSRRPSASESISILSNIKPDIVPAYQMSMLELQFFDVNLDEKNDEICVVLLGCARYVSSSIFALFYPLN